MIREFDAAYSRENANPLTGAIQIEYEDAQKEYERAKDLLIRQLSFVTVDDLLAILQESFGE